MKLLVIAVCILLGTVSCGEYEVDTSETVDTPQGEDSQQSASSLSPDSHSSIGTMSEESDSTPGDNDLSHSHEQLNSDTSHSHDHSSTVDQSSISHSHDLDKSLSHSHDHGEYDTSSSDSSSSSSSDSSSSDSSSSDDTYYDRSDSYSMSDYTSSSSSDSDSSDTYYDSYETYSSGSSSSYSDTSSYSSSDSSSDSSISTSGPGKIYEITDFNSDGHVWYEGENCCYSYWKKVRNFEDQGIKFRILGYNRQKITWCKQEHCHGCLGVCSTTRYTQRMRIKTSYHNKNQLKANSFVHHLRCVHYYCYATAPVRFPSECICKKTRHGSG